MHELNLTLFPDPVMHDLSTLHQFPAHVGHLICAAACFTSSLFAYQPVYFTVRSQFPLCSIMHIMNC